jgi:hypothetical protein
MTETKNIFVKQVGPTKSGWNLFNVAITMKLEVNIEVTAKIVCKINKEKIAEESVEVSKELRLIGILSNVPLRAGSARMGIGSEDPILEEFPDLRGYAHLSGDPIVLWSTIKEDIVGSTFYDDHGLAHIPTRRICQHRTLKSTLKILQQ